jgi:hypothetical protein
VAEGDKNDVADIGCQQNVVRWVLFDDTPDRMFRIVLGRVSILVIATVPELGVDSCKNLLRSGRVLGVGQTVCILILIFVKHRVLRRRCDR